MPVFSFFVHYRPQPCLRHPFLFAAASRHRFARMAGNPAAPRATQRLPALARSAPDPPEGAVGARIKKFARTSLRGVQHRPTAPKAGANGAGLMLRPSQCRRRAATTGGAACAQPRAAAQPRAERSRAPQHHHNNCSAHLHAAGTACSTRWASRGTRARGTFVAARLARPSRACAARSRRAASLCCLPAAAACLPARLHACLPACRPAGLRTSHIPWPASTLAKGRGRTGRETPLGHPNRPSGHQSIARLSFHNIIQYHRPKGSPI